MMQILSKPWPWYVAGPLIGLTVPLLLILGNKSFGISSSLRHICAACLPAGIPFFKYDWRKEAWNLFFVAGIFLGGFLASFWLKNPEPVQVHPQLHQELSKYGIQDYSSLVPKDIINWNNLFTLQGILMMVLGGFLIGFGTRYAGGCTSGHAIMGLSTLQWPSLIAVICFMVGGFFSAHFIVPLILSLK
ncbi:MAG: YeeE/YedE family protein [Flavobacteriales bacterium]|nr:YeeE/YedE family protein [Flavobacteriales bacterium]MCX7767710.1 YeeE/YedE family protein [Flavobacteriales bacterium]MDW8409395.1 YeeE/YedE thiosulfate transporter family protein [Flavobacteriales bacterium]